MGGKCHKCIVGAILQDGFCFKPALGVDAYCSFYDGGYCFGCVSGYRLISYICIPDKRWNFIAFILIPLLDIFFSREKL